MEHHIDELEDLLYLFASLFILYWAINNDVIVSGEQQRDSRIHTHVCILPQTPLSSRLLHSIEHSSPCFTVGPCWLSI